MSLHSDANRTLVIMAKAPGSGRVKTRLAENFPAAAVTELYRSLLEDTLELARSLSGVAVAVVCPHSDEDELASFFRHTVQIVAQKGDGLAAGLTSVFQHFADDGRRRVIAFNSDTPHLAPSVLEHAFEVLEKRDVVIGPTHDGGYYLVGAKAAHPSLFKGDGLGTESALDKLLTRTKVLALSTGFTQPFYDIDVASDLIRLTAELQLAPAKAPRTAAWISEWRAAVEQLSRNMSGT